MKPLSPEEITKGMNKIDDWFYVDKSLEKEFKLKNFADSLAFIIKIGIEAEKMDHHPDLLLHSWNKVKITLSTHDAGGVTENDIKLAQIIDKIKL
jgi:4a-hydroxytetrahydrobiopterin dehydratase